MLEKKLKEVQGKVDKDPEFRKEATNVLKEYNEAVLDEEKLLDHLAKVEWLNERKGIEAIFIIFIMSMELDMWVMMFLLNLLNTSKDFLVLEIKEALKSIDDNKAPGPDGYTYMFFKAAWKIVGDDVSSAFKEFFQIGKLLSEMNATIIYLNRVPKQSAFILGISQQGLVVFVILVSLIRPRKMEDPSDTPILDQLWRNGALVNGLVGVWLVVTPSSLSKLLIHMSSVDALAKALYSAFVDDRETGFCRVDFHEMMLVPM
ncbi:hypothetical protein Tco_0583374 [Tanacetum coccineum]